MMLKLLKLLVYWQCRCSALLVWNH